MRFLIFALSVLLLAPAPAALACSCAEFSAERVLAEFGPIFIGKKLRLEVVSSTERFDEISATFRILENFKGEPVEEIEIFTDNASRCSSDFEIAKEYLAVAFERNGRLETGVCLGTELLDGPSERPVALRELTRHQ